MIGLVFAGHGKFPEGLRNSTEMISGEMIQTEVVSLMPEDDPSSYGKRLEKAVNRMDTGDGVLVLADLRGGTPFNQSLMLCQKKHLYIVVGMNLPLALTANLNRNEDTTLDELAQCLIDAAPDSIDLVKYTYEGE